MAVTEFFETHPVWLEDFRIKTMEIFQKYSLPRWMVFIIDCLTVFTVFCIAYLLRFNFNLTGLDFSAGAWQSIITVAAYAAFSLLFHSYSGLIRHTTLTDIALVFLVTTTSSFLLLCLSLVARFFSLGGNFVIPISIIIIHYVTVTVFLFFMRVFVKMVYRFATNSLKDKKNVLIYGAGKMGFIVKRLIEGDPNGDYHVAGFIDNNKQLQGKMLNSLPVLNPSVVTAGYLKKNKIDTLIIAINKISPGRKSEIIGKAVDLGLEILETPAVNKWLNGELQLRQLQKVKPEDLLGRDPITLNMDLIDKGLNGKVIMVTGAAGSIGSEIVRQLTLFNIRKLVLIDQAETPMFQLDNELKSSFSQCPVQLILADITEPETMEGIFQLYHPEIVFHAAAYKHVPLMEDNPHEAIRVNVGGTKLMVKLAVRYGVRKFVMISTDKAVNPTNVMGASKRICEQVVRMYAKKTDCITQFIITRFGNVLGSNGSVIPTFAKQIENGGPVTVTHPQITRYFMTIPEACQLVLEAGFMGNGGEIFVFDMGKPVKIADLADQMIRLSGFVPGRDIKIIFTGLRPGEKLYEELLASHETTKATYHPKIRIATNADPVKADLLLRIENFLTILYTISKQEVVDYCKELVPEFNTTNDIYSGNPSGGSAPGSENRMEEKHITRVPDIKNDQSSDIKEKDFRN